MRSVSTPRGMKRPQPKKTPGTFRPLERGFCLMNRGIATTVPGVKNVAEEANAPNHVIIPFTNLGSEPDLMLYVPAQRVVIAYGERTCELNTCQTADDTAPRILAD